MMNVKDSQMNNRYKNPLIKELKWLSFKLTALSMFSASVVVVTIMLIRVWI